jgi:hypothetical protein
MHAVNYILYIHVKISPTLAEETPYNYRKDRSFVRDLLNNL